MFIVNLLLVSLLKFVCTKKKTHYTVKHRFLRHGAKQVLVILRLVENLNFFGNFATQSAQLAHDADGV
jgi:hypothetical protein